MDYRYRNRKKTTSQKTKKDLLVVFTGSDWNDPSKALIKDVFTGDFFKKGSKKFVLCNIDIVQDENLMDKTLLDANYKIATEYGVQSLPMFVLQTSEGDRLCLIRLDGHDRNDRRILDLH